MDELQEQGSSESPSLEAPQEVNPFDAHLAGGGVTEEAQPQATDTTTEEAIQPEVEQEPQGRAEQRIQELIRQNSELNQRAQMADQLQMFIASNPQARAAYEQAIGQGATPEQAQQAAAQTQQTQQTGKWYGDVAQDPTAVPEWDPFDENVVREHAKVLIHDMVQDALAPLMQQFQPVTSYVEQLQQQQVQAEVQSTLSSVQEAIYAEIPSAKDNQAHFTLTKGKLLEQIQTLPQQYQQAIYDYEYLNPQDRQIVGQVLTQCVKQASQQAKELINLLGPAQQQANAQEVPKPFAEGGTNLVAPRPNEPGNPFLAHINRHS